MMPTKPERAGVHIALNTLMTLIILTHFQLGNVGISLLPECSFLWGEYLFVVRVKHWRQSSCIGTSPRVLARVFVYWRQSSCIGACLRVLARVFVYWRESSCIGASLRVLAPVFVYWHLSSCIGIVGSRLYRLSEHVVWRSLGVCIGCPYHCNYTPHSMVSPLAVF